MTGKLSDEQIKTLDCNDERCILDDIGKHFDALQLKNHYDVADEFNRIDSIIMSDECGENIEIESDSLADHWNKAKVSAGYEAAVRSMAEILGLDYKSLWFAIAELYESDAKGISIDEFMKVYEQNKFAENQTANTQ